MKLSNMISEQARLRRIARENDVFRDNTIIQLKIEDLKSLIKKLQNNECKNFFCNQDLTRLEPGKKLYSVSTFRSSGRRHYTFYYCSLRCFNIIRSRCGLVVPIVSGQSTLSS